MSEGFGAVIEEGPSDWQIFQQDDRGVADIRVSGRWWCPEPKPAVHVRLVCEDTGAPPASALDWTRATTRPDRTWSARLRGVPAGGLYRLETQLRNAVLCESEWAYAGDMRHFLGVGDLWVVAGQSNSAGYGRGPCPDPPELGVHVFNNAMRWALAAQPLNESTDTAHPVNRETANSAHAPWLHWARRVKRQVGFPIGLVQASLGGSALREWLPPKGRDPQRRPLYETMLDVVAAAGGKVRGVLWYQGESDTSGQSARTYERRFVRAVRAWRRALRNQRLHVLTVQLNRCLGPRTEAEELGWSRVREAQRRAARRLEGVTVSPTLDLPLTDEVHVGASGNVLLAQRVAAAALGAVYGRDVDFRAPEPASARRSRSGRAIDVRFENVTSRFCCCPPAGVPFAVVDSRGPVPIEEVCYSTGRPKVRLRLGRALRGRTVLHGAPGCDPPPVPCDRARLMPMLGFHGFPVQ